MIARLRDLIGSGLWRLHLPGLAGWWDAGTDAGEWRRYQRRQREIIARWSKGRR